MTYLDPDIYRYESIEDNGLIGTFFENIKNNNIKSDTSKALNNSKIYTNKSSLYINTFNAPQQVKMLIESFEKYEPKFLEKTEITLINNSTNESLFEEYDKISNEYSFKEIRKGNIGVCGGRQLAAEDFAESNNKYMFFFEDDMFIDLSETKCNFGFNKKVNHLYDTLLRIMDIENYDFLKFSFSEFYGHNGEQWSWHNVPEEKRKEYFGQTNKRPLTNFNNIKSVNGNPYIDGEIYYSNWPHIIGHQGNQKCFLDVKWDYPYEQTWMSHMYTLNKEKRIKTAILLASPITHDRVIHYGKEERREN